MTNKKLIGKFEIGSWNNKVDYRLSSNGGEYYRYYNIYDVEGKYYLHHESSYDGSFCEACGSYNEHLTYHNDEEYLELCDNAPERNCPAFCKYEEIEDIEEFLGSDDYWCVA